MTTLPKSYRTTVILLRVIAVFGMVPSLIALALSWWAFNDSREFLFRARAVEGIVIQHKRTEPGNLYTPVIRFADLDGNAHQFDATIATPTPSYEVDEKVPLVYSLDNPKLVRIDYWATHWGFATMAFAVFLLGLMVALTLWIVIPALMMRKILASPTHGESPKSTDA